MNAWPKIILGLVVWGSALGSGCSNAMTNQPPTVAAAIQAIQQAPDPSAAIAAYGSGLAITVNDPKLHEAYLARMVDMGLPEMAFHQAETLTTLEPSNGLAWGVVAYVDARRGQMPEAVSAINLAGQFASSNRFVAHTAGEILAWYDFKADKTKLPDNAKDGLTRIRGLLDKQPAFTEAYGMARRAYQSQTGAAQPSVPGGPAQTAPAGQTPAVPATSPASPGAYAPQAVPGPQTVVPSDQGGAVTYVSPPVEPMYTPVYYPLYYDWAPDYCYDWGPGWCAPGPWCWWYPCGFWAGCGFFPFGLTFAFGDFDHFHHGYGFDHGRGFGYGGEFGRGGDLGVGGNVGVGRGGDLSVGGNFGHGGGFGNGRTFASAGGFGNRNNAALWHNGTQGSGSFFGTPARPSASLAGWSAKGSLGRSSTASGNTSTHWWGSAGEGGMTGSRTALASGGTALAQSSARAPQGIWGAGRAAATGSGAISRAPTAAAPATHFWGGAGGGYQGARAYSAPGYGAPAYSAPRYAAPTARSFGSYRSFPSYGGRWARSAPSFSAPRSFGGGFSGGGFHSFGGGFGGGGFHGGGFGGGGGFHGGGGGHR